MLRRQRTLRWALTVAWALAPVTVWPVLGEALRQRSQAVHVAAAAAGWASWAAVLVATLVPHPVGLTMLRCATPAAVAAVVAALVTGSPDAGAAVVGGAWAVAVAVVSFLPAVGLVFVNGPAYPNERRFPLAPPGPVLLGPIELAWVLTAGAPVAGLLLLAAGQWAAGAVCAVAGAVAVRYLGRSLHRLSRRWVVFVPAGVVLHDPMTLADPLLVRRQSIAGLGPAAVGTDALDLSLGAPGLALELRTKEDFTVGVVRPRHPEELRATSALLLTPTRPGAVLAEAAARSLPVRAPGPQAATPPPSTSSPS